MGPVVRATEAGASEVVAVAGGVTEGALVGAPDTDMAGTLAVLLAASGVSGRLASFLVSTVTAETVCGGILAGVWERLGRVLAPDEVRPVDGGLGLVLEVVVGQGERGLLLEGPGDEVLFLGLTALSSVFVLGMERDCLFFIPFSFVRALFSFSFSLSLSFFSFVFFSAGVEWRLCWR